MIRVLIADDEPLIREGIRAVLESAPDIEVVAVAPDGRSAVDQVLRHRIDVALIDIKMPRLDGLGALDELRRRGSHVPVIMLTSFGEQENVLHAVQSGAAGFVLKHCTPEELIRAVRAGHEGDAYLSPQVTRMLLGMVQPIASGATAAASRGREAALRLKRLTERESEVLQLVAEGYANAEIGRRLGMSEATIKTYVSRILTKLDCANRVQAALLMRDVRTG